VSLDLQTVNAYCPYAFIFMWVFMQQINLLFVMGMSALTAVAALP